MRGYSPRKDEIVDISFVEFLVIGVIAFLVLGPEELVKRAHQIGRAIGKAKTYGNNLKVLAEEEYLKEAESEKSELGPQKTD